MRIAYWAIITPDWVPVADADQYVQLARSLARGHGYQLVFPQLEPHNTAFRPPLYPVLLTPGEWLLPNALWPARLLTALVGSVAVVEATVLTVRLSNERAGFIAAAILCVYPPLLANDTITLTESLAAALLLWGLLALDRRAWTTAGIATGLLLLTRPNAYLVIAIFAAVIFYRAGTRRCLTYLAIVLAFAAPWIVRNSVDVGTPRLVTSDGFTLAAIYSPQAQRAHIFVDPVFSPAFDDPDVRWAQFDEGLWNERLTQLAIDGIRDNPTYIGENAWRNVRAYLELTPGISRWAEENDGRNMEFRQATLPFFYAVTACGVAGVVLLARNRRSWPLIAVVAQYALVSILLVAPPRHRAPFDLLCCIGLGIFIDALVRRYREPSEEQGPSALPEAASIGVHYGLVAPADRAESRGAGHG